MSALVPNGYVRWVQSAMLGVLAAAAFAVWSYRFLPEAPSSTLIGRSSSQVRTEARQEYLKFRAALQNLAGPKAKGCGAFSLQNATESGLACSIQALSEGKSFWLAIQLQGTDSDVWTGLAKDEKGNSFNVNFNSDKSSGGHPNADPSLTITECACPEVHPENWEGLDRQYGFSCLCVLP